MILCTMRHYLGPPSPWQCVCVRVCVAHLRDGDCSLFGWLWHKVCILSMIIFVSIHALHVITSNHRVENVRPLMVYLQLKLLLRLSQHVWANA